MKTLDVMIDLETMGTSAGCMILSIGACTFDTQKTFYTRIQKDSCPALRADPETMAWWQKQSFEAQQEAFSGDVLLLNALGDFSTWWNRLEGDNKSKFIWGNGADFDLPILKAAYEAVMMKEPWAPWNGRCYRTLKNLYFGIKAPEFQGVKHNALADAMHQARHAREILSKHFSE